MTDLVDTLQNMTDLVDSLRNMTDLVDSLSNMTDLVDFLSSMTDESWLLEHPLSTITDESCEAIRQLPPLPSVVLSLLISILIADSKQIPCQITWI